MGVVLLALGSRGDVQPMAVLAGALQRRGIDARVVALAEYADLVADHGAGFVPVPGRLADALTRTPAAEWLARTPAGQARLLQQWVARLAEGLTSATLATVRRDDLVLTGVLTRGLAQALTEAHGVRMATVVFTAQPPTLQRESHFFHRWFTGWTPYDRAGVRLSWLLSTNVGQAVTRTVRRRLGLPGRDVLRETRAADAHPTLVAASPVLVPPAPDWPGGVHQTGWLAPGPSATELDADLTAFLDASRPVFVGYGSFSDFAGERDLALVVAAAEASGVRVVTPTIPGVSPGSISPQVFATGPVPHDRLLNRTAGVVHHGGAGTTHAGLASGRPSVAVPFGVDQPYHAWRLHRLGVGPAPVPIHRLTAARLACLLDALTSGAYDARAAEVGGRLRAEDGVTATVTLLQRRGLLH